MAARSSRPQTGLGVGLALSRHLVEMHGGSIEAHSAGVGHGSRFIVRLPTKHAQKSDARTVTKVAEADVTGYRVLVVDDNLDFATSLATILREMGNDVRVEHDGVKGLVAAEAFEPAIAFVDIGLPGMSGYELAQHLRVRERNGSILLIAVTGWGQDADKRRAREAGFDDHVVKPLDPAQIPAILARAAERRSASGPAS